MSKIALEDYRRARSEQQSRNEARAIRRGINQARQNVAGSTFRWPFELLQNAIDSGARPGKTQVSIAITVDEDNLAVSHDGMPFSLQDLAALLSGGSNKEFESELTTGRFGTGFLTTHAISTRLTIRGIHQLGDEREQFSLEIDRHGDEEQILANILACDEAIAQAIPIAAFEDVASAEFCYPLESRDIVDQGLDAFRSALPYLYATRKSLGKVTIETPEYHETWSVGQTVVEDVEGGVVSLTPVKVVSTSGELNRVVASFCGKADVATAIVAVDKTDGVWRISLPRPTDRRIYRDYPLQASTFLPIAFVLNGKFDPDVERLGFALTADNQAVVVAAFDAIVVGVRYAVSKGWQQAHLLAAVRAPASTFHFDDSSELAWWQEELSKLADSLAKLPIVATREGMLPARSDDGPFADFVVPRLSKDDQEDQATHERMWSLIDRSTSLYPPDLAVSQDWTNTALGWSDLSVALNLIDLRELTRYVKGAAKALNDIEVRETPLDWYVNYLDVLGECREKTSIDVIDYLEKFVPNQVGALLSPSQLALDGGISEVLKDLCSEVGDRLRERLVSLDLEEVAHSDELQYVLPLLERIVVERETEGAVLDAITIAFNDVLPDSVVIPEDLSTIVHASLRMLDYIWETHGESGAALAWKIPLLVKSDRSVHWSKERKLMAPSISWPIEAQPFSNVYPDDRVLSDVYQQYREVGPQRVASLVAWDMIFPEPLVSVTLPELKEKRLLAISAESETTNVVVSNIRLSSMALLAPEVLNRCASGREYAALLLGLILCYIVPRDAGWREQTKVIGRRAGREVEVTVRRALWVADLKIRAWVPQVLEDETMQQAQASSSTIADLLDPTWLGSDAISFLAACFNFDTLDLLFLGRAGDPAMMRVREELARLVQTAGSDVEFYERIVQVAQAAAKRENDLQRARNLGLAVEAAVRETLEGYGLNVERIDRGYDFKIDVESDAVLEDFGLELRVESHLLEIKATTTGRAGMTPLQARTASTTTDPYVLCVVDLRGIPQEQLDGPWTVAQIEKLARLLPTIGSDIEGTWRLVDEAVSGDGVRIRNESALRYEVPPEVWEEGVSILEWVSTIR